MSKEEKSVSQNSAKNEPTTQAPKTALAENESGYARVNLPPKKSHKKLIIGLSAGIGGFFVLLIILVLVFTLGRISEKDYTEAEDQAKEVYGDASGIGSISSYLSAESQKKKASEIEKDLEEVESGFKELGDKKAVEKDKDLKQKYDELKESFADFREYYKTNIEQVSFADVASEMSKSSYASSDELILKLKSAEKMLSNIEVDLEVSKEYKEDLAECISNSISATEKYLEMKKSGKYDSEIYSKLTAAQRDCNNADNEYNSEIREKYKDASGFVGDLYDFYLEIRNHRTKNS